MSSWNLNRKPKPTPQEIMLQDVLSRISSNTWHVGEEVPSDKLGRTGDLYLNKKTSEFYRLDQEWELQGVLKGEDGHNPVHVSDSEPESPIEGDLWVNNGLHVLTHGTWREITGKPGGDGAKGREIVLRQSNGFLQWQYKNDDGWKNLLQLSEVTGPRGPRGDRGDKGDKGDDGREIELRKTATHLQWRYVGEKWRNLIELEELRGKIEFHGGGGGSGNIVIAGITDITAGANITIDKTNPKNPIISASGGGGGAGDVVGPSSSTDKAIARYDSTTGKLLQDSGVTIDDNDNLTLPESSLYFDEDQTVGFKYTSDIGILTTPDLSVQGSSWALYANTGADGLGAYLPSIEIANNRINIGTDSGGGGTNDIVLQAGTVIADGIFQVNNGNKRAQLDPSNITAANTRTFAFQDQDGTLALTSDLDDYVPKSGATMTGDLVVPDEAYGSGWDGSLEVPTKNAVYDKIETIGGGDSKITTSWNLITSALNAITANTGSATVSTSSVHVSLRTNTTANSSATIHNENSAWGAGQTYSLWNATQYFGTWVRWFVLGSDFDMFIGVGLPVVAGAGITFGNRRYYGFKRTRTSGGTIVDEAVNSNGSGETATGVTLRTAAASDNVNLLSAKFTPGVDIKFYVDGALVATHTTDLPNANQQASQLCLAVSNKGVAVDSFINVQGFSTTWETQT